MYLVTEFQCSSVNIEYCAENPYMRVRLHLKKSGRSSDVCSVIHYKVVRRTLLYNIRKFYLGTQLTVFYVALAA